MGYARLRTRGKNNSFPGRYETWYSGGYLSTTQGSGIATHHDRCEDSVEAPPYTEPHNLVLSKIAVEPLRLHGEIRSGIYRYHHFGWNPTNFTGYQYASQPSVHDLGAYKAQAMANMNPSRSAVDLPLFLFEFKDFPRMLRNMGNLLGRGGRNPKPSDVADGYLAYQFGWGPLLSDLSKLVDLGESIDNRIRELRSAGRYTRVKRTLSRGETSSVWQYTARSANEGNFVLNIRRTDRHRVWFTAKRIIHDVLPEEGLRWQAIRSTLGLGAPAAVIWNMVPWSWLIDYFTNVGDLLDARRGNIRWEFKDLFIMGTFSREDAADSVANQVRTMSFSGGKRSYTVKARSYQGSNFTTGFAFAPFLTGKQMSILGALATARATKRLRGRLR